MGHECLNFLRHAHSFFDCTFHANKTDAILIFHQFTNGSNSTITEMVDVIDLHRDFDIFSTLTRVRQVCTAISQSDEVPNDLNNVALGQNRILERLLDAELVIELKSTDLTEVVPLGVEEQVVEQIVGCVERGWVTRPGDSL